MFGLRRSAGEAERAIQATPWGDWGDGAATSWAGPRVNSTSAMQLLTVYGCNRFICEGISTLPVDVFRRLPDGTQEEIAKPAWLERPTVDLDRIAWLTQILTSLLLDGNAYVRLVYDSAGRLTELPPLDPAAVSIWRRNGRKEYLVNGMPFSSFELLHIPGVMRPGSDKGMSPVEAARQSVGMGLAAQEHGGRFFSQGANLSGVIEHPGELPPDAARELANAWARRHSGNKKAHLPGVLEGGATWKATGVTNEQAQFLETRQYTAAEIASQMFLIDPTEFGISMDKGSSITYANLEQRNARKVQVTFLPWIVRLETAFSALLQKPRYVKFNLKALLRADTKTRYETYQIGIGTGFLGTEEARELEDLPPRDDLQPAAVALPTGG